MYECTDDNCRTVTVFNKQPELDGVRCSRCEGPVIPKRFKPINHNPSERAWYVRERIIKENKKYCFDLTPEQVEAVLLLGDDFQSDRRESV